MPCGIARNESGAAMVGRGISGRRLGWVARLRAVGGVGVVPKGGRRGRRSRRLVRGRAVGSEGLALARAVAPGGGREARLRAVSAFAVPSLRKVVGIERCRNVPVIAHVALPDGEREKGGLMARSFFGSWRAGSGRAVSLGLASYRREARVVPPSLVSLGSRDWRDGGEAVGERLPRSDRAGFDWGLDGTGVEARSGDVERGWRADGLLALRSRSAAFDEWAHPQFAGASVGF
jgi:hypothetical protein